MASSINEKDVGDTEQQLEYAAHLEERDAKYGGHQARLKLEKKLLLKVDLRMSILIVIYILNYVRVSCAVFATMLFNFSYR